MTGRCSCGGRLWLYQWGERAWEQDWLCSRDACEANRAFEERQEELHQQYLQDTFWNEDTEEREYY